MRKWSRAYPKGISSELPPFLMIFKSTFNFSSIQQLLYARKHVSGELYLVAFGSQIVNSCEFLFPEVMSGQMGLQAR